MGPLIISVNCTSPAALSQNGSGHSWRMLYFPFHQGREKEAIVFSAVRSNAQQSVGFLADFR